MLTPDRIKPFLVHPDSDVRDLVTEYFTDSWSNDPDVLPMVLEACERFGFKENLHNLILARHLFITEESLDRLLDHLTRVKDELATEHLNRVIAQAPGEMLRSRREEIERHPNVLPKTRSRLQHRSDFLDWSGERLWAELQDFARRSEDKHYVGEIDHDYADDLIDALSRHDVPDAPTICRLLKELEPEHGWLEIFLVILAGRRRLREAVSILVDKFRIDTDYLLDRASDALAQINDLEAVRLIRQATPDDPWDYRLFATGVLGKIKHPESEAAALSLLEWETDETIRMFLCRALCELLSEQSLDAVVREAQSGNDFALRELAVMAMAVATVLNVEPSGELEVLEQERRRQQASMRRAQRLLASPPKSFRVSNESIPEPNPREYPLPSATQPIRNTGARVGRNDPCPCGSGKKYKKCCGRAG